MGGITNTKAATKVPKPSATSVRRSVAAARRDTAKDGSVSSTTGIVTGRGTTGISSSITHRPFSCLASRWTSDLNRFLGPGCDQRDHHEGEAGLGNLSAATCRQTLRIQDLGGHNPILL